MPSCWKTQATICRRSLRDGLPVTNCQLMIFLDESCSLYIDTVTKDRALQVFLGLRAVVHIEEVLAMIVTMDMLRPSAQFFITKETSRPPSLLYVFTRFSSSSDIPSRSWIMEQFHRQLILLSINGRWTGGEIHIPFHHPVYNSNLSRGATTGVGDYGKHR